VTGVIDRSRHSGAIGYTQTASVVLTAAQLREIAAFVEQMERERERKHA
jgi:hypothetical protein